MPKTLDLTGQRYESLVVLRLVPKSDVPLDQRKARPGKYYLVRCACGTEKILQGVAFKYGQLQSCGCHANGPAWNRKPLGEAARWAAFQQFKVQSKRRRRDIPVALSFKEFVAIASQPCRYCGLEWSKEIGKRSGRDFLNGTYRYNGIDRIDSAVGYVPGNCAPACKSCNFAKNELTVEQFEAWLTRAFKHLEAKRAAA